MADKLAKARASFFQEDHSDDDDDVFDISKRKRLVPPKIEEEADESPPRKPGRTASFLRSQSNDGKPGADRDADEAPARSTPTSSAKKKHKLSQPAAKARSCSLTPPPETPKKKVAQDEETDRLWVDIDSKADATEDASMEPPKITPHFVGETIQIKVFFQHRTEQIGPLKFKYSSGAIFLTLVHVVAEKFGTTPENVVLVYRDVVISSVATPDSLGFGPVTKIAAYLRDHYAEIMATREAESLRTIQSLVSSNNDTKEDEESLERTTAWTIKLNDRSAEPMRIRVQGTTKIGSIVKAYAKSKGVEPGKVRLKFEETTLGLGETLEGCDVEDGDMLEVSLH
ncbi:hypothetical protein HK101_005379 [Irineochytrium annulatum]|nr:hypothetical protein HK101_005379 [Irineochytrium annulatum]